MAYDYRPHTADIMVAIRAPDLGGVLQDATAVMRELEIGGGTATGREYRTLCVHGAAADELLLRYLQELLVLFDTERFVPSAATVDAATDTEATVRLAGERFDPERHEAQPEVKAITRHLLRADRAAGGWEATVVFDV